MSNDRNMWEVRELSNGVALELRAGDSPALVLAQGEPDLLCLVHLQERRGLHQPASPVFGQACGPVCIGEVTCEAWQFQPWKQC